MKYTLLLFLVLLLSSCKGEQEEYMCTPCNLSCDTLIFNKPGTCPDCEMKLVKKSDLENKIEIVEDYLPSIMNNIEFGESLLVVQKKNKFNIQSNRGN